MKINCEKCKKDLGEIRDGSLRKGMVYLCKECNTQRIALELMRRNKKYKHPFGGIFKDIFGGDGR